MYQVLIVEDEKLIRELIVEYLSKEMTCVEAGDGRQALRLLLSRKFDIVILDIIMPGIDGFAVLREMRKTLHTPVIMLSARSDEYDKLLGFELGVDDYVTKPFNPKELSARIKAILARGERPASPNFNLQVYSFKGLTVDVSKRIVEINGKKTELPGKEFEILLFLCKNRDIAFSRETLLKEVWGYESFGVDRTVDSHIKNLRKNLGQYRDYIRTVWGVGYKFDDSRQ